MSERLSDSLWPDQKPDKVSYRAEVRRTMQAFSAEALAYQDARIIGGIDREECDREIMRRERGCRYDNLAS